jgi:hypothetical protein
MSRLVWLVLCGGWLNLSCAAKAPPPAVTQAPPAAASGASAPTASLPADEPAKVGQAPAADAGRVVHWKGSRVSLWAPNAMQRPTRLQYLRQESPLVVVAVAEMTADNEAATKQILSGAKQGAELKQETPAAHGSARGFTGKSEPDPSGMARQILALADGPAVTIVIAQYQASAAPLVTRILDSVVLDGKAELDPLALNGISIGDDAGFAVSNGFSQPVMFADKGRKPPIGPGEPSFVLMSLPYVKPDTSDRELGIMLGTTLAKYQPDMSRASMDSFAIDGREAFIIAAPGMYESTAVGVYGFILRRPDLAFAGFGHVRAVAMKQVGPRFERLVKSIRLDDSIISPPPVEAAPLKPQ